MIDNESARCLQGVSPASILLCSEAALVTSRAALVTSAVTP